MDNLKYYNQSLAYDFEMFAPKFNTEPKNKDNIISMPKPTAKKRKAAHNKLSASATLILTVVLILAGLCGNIALRLQINEVNEQIGNVKTEISELNSEKICLEVEMQRRISYSNLELQAVQMGMKKPDKENVTYIKVNDKNAAKTDDGSFVNEK